MLWNFIWNIKGCFKPNGGTEIKVKYNRSIWLFDRLYIKDISKTLQLCDKDFEFVLESQRYFHIYGNSIWTLDKNEGFIQPTYIQGSGDRYVIHKVSWKHKRYQRYMSSEYNIACNCLDRYWMFSQSMRLLADRFDDQVFDGLQTGRRVDV